MEENEMTFQTQKTFEEIKHIDKDGREYWYARELQVALDYKEWRKFENVINKAKESCENSGNSAFEQLVGADKLSKRANNTEVLNKIMIVLYEILLIVHLYLSLKHL